MNNKIFKAKLNLDFFIINNRIVLSEAYKKNVTAKKLTGTRLGSIFEDTSSQLKTWMQMFNLYSEPFDEIYSLVGQTIEPKLRDYYESLTNTSYLSYNPKKINWDLFKDSKIFGGIPDGEPLNNNSQIDYLNNQRMIEIKTASIDQFLFKKKNGFYYMQKDNGLPIVKNKDLKYNSWFLNNKITIPNNYLFQLSLYMYLKKVELGAFIIGFVPTLNYKNPSSYDVISNEIRIVNYHLNLEKFQWYIDYATKWWNTYIDTGISPKLSQQDLDWFNEAYDNH
ncbi:MAG: hypothetical protein IIT97_02350 [Mycoplasmataceae bacterium]|nr:hypothetical protein [Mycoplasmataceae bacterium]